MTLFKIETRADSALVEINTEDRERIAVILKEFLKGRDYYYVDGLLTILQEKGFSVKKVMPININWWEIQPVADIDETVEQILRSQ